MTGNKPSTTNLKLLIIEANQWLALSETIFSYLQSDHDLTAEEIGFWLERGKQFAEYAAVNSRIGQSILTLLEAEESSQKMFAQLDKNSIVH